MCQKKAIIFEKARGYTLHSYCVRGMKKGNIFFSGCGHCSTIANSCLASVKTDTVYFIKSITKMHSPDFECKGFIPLSGVSCAGKPRGSGRPTCYRISSGLVYAVNLFRGRVAKIRLSVYHGVAMDRGDVCGAPHTKVGVDRNA